MLAHYKKILACTLLTICTASPMDNPPQPIIISEGLTQNIHAIKNWMSFLKNRIQELPENDSPHKSLFVEQKKAAKNLLETNRTMLTQIRDLHENTANLMLKNQQFINRMEEEKKVNDQHHNEFLQKQQEYDERYKEATALRNLNVLTPLAESQMPPITPTNQKSRFTYPEVTHFPPINVDQLVQNTEDRIMHRIDGILEEQDHNIVTEGAKITTSYQQDIKKLNEQIGVTTKELEKKKKNFEKRKKLGLFMCAGITSLIFCTVFITKYFFPQ